MSTTLPKVKDYMTTSVVTITKDINVCKAIGLLLKHNISGAPVVDEDNLLIGILSEKDCLRIMANESFHEFPCGNVEEYMTLNPKSVAPDTDIFHVVDIFMHSVYRRTPVLENGKLVGIISRRDVLKAIQDLTSSTPDSTDGEYKTGYLTDEMKGSLVE
jgi:CBS domain-containing protein